MLSASEEPHFAMSRQWLRYGYRISHCGSIVAFLVSRLYQIKKKLHVFLRIQWGAGNGRKNVLNDACPVCDSDYCEMILALPLCLVFQSVSHLTLARIKFGLVLASQSFNGLPQ